MNFQSGNFFLAHQVDVFIESSLFKLMVTVKTLLYLWEAYFLLKAREGKGLFYSYKNFTINLTFYYTLLLYNTTGTILWGAKDHDYPDKAETAHACAKARSFEPP